jgi:GT2 family glycosyltransferase
MNSRPDVGLCSSAVEGYVGNPNQESGSEGFRTEPRVVAFISIYIPRMVYKILGPLDERFTAYGGDDMDYCKRILQAGLLLGIHGGCVVTHEETLSTYRSKPDKFNLFQEGLRIYENKWRSG